MAPVKVARIPKNSLGDYLLSGMGYAGSDWRGKPELFELGLETYRKAVGMGFVHLPLFLVHDLRMIAEFGNEYTFADQVWEGYDAYLSAEYSNRVLNRLLREFCVQQALEVLAYYRALSGPETKPDPSEFDDVADRADRLTMIILERLAPHWPRAYSVNAAHLRDLTLANPVDVVLGELEPVWNAAVGGGPSIATMLESFVFSATGASAGKPPIIWSKVIGPEDLFELEHLHVLDKEYLRIQARNLIAVRESIAPFDPHRLRFQEEESEVETLFMDQSQYPTGGFSELTTSGSFDNLVLSELMYMGESIGGEIDLFDVRFVENELLYYMRDSGHSLRKRRTLNLVIDLRSPLNFKYPTHPYQLGTIVSGFVLGVVRDSNVLFGNDSVHFRISLLAPERGEGDEAARKLREVLEILLEAQIQRGKLATEVVTRLDLAELASATRKSYAIVFSPNPDVLAQWTETLAVLHRHFPPLFGVSVSLAEGEAIAESEQVSVLQLDLASSSLDALADALFNAVLGA
jgi:hypothetical protein